MQSLSLVIPVFNEEQNIPILAAEIESSMATVDIDWECIWVDDNSTDKSLNELKLLKYPHRHISLTRNSGQSTALMAGIDNAKFETIVTLDADLQNDPKDIPHLLKAFKDCDVVCGYRLNRKDNKLIRVIPSKIANFIARKVTGIKVRDLGCTLRIFKKELISDYRIMGEMHRVLVIYFAIAGAKITEIPTNHRPRIYGKSKYGIERTLKFLADLTLARLTRILMTRPLYFFGLVALTFFVLSASSAIFCLIYLSNSTNSINNLIWLICSTIIIGFTILISSIGLLFEVNLRYAVSHNKGLQYNLRSK